MSLADHKGHSSGAWFAAGFFFGVFGLIAAAGLPDIPAAVATNLLNKKCPDCAETIRVESYVCKFCGKKFSKDQVLIEVAGFIKSEPTSFLTQVLQILRSINDSSIVPHLLKYIEIIPVSEQYGASYKNLTDALQLLTKNAKPSILPDLVAIAKKTQSNFKKKQLIDIFASLQDSTSIPFLLDSLGKPQISDSAAKALQQLGQVAIPGLEQFQKDAKRSERKLAEQIISQIRQTPPK